MAGAGLNGGSDARVAVDIASNPGINSLRMGLYFDDSRLALKEVVSENQSFRFDNVNMERNPVMLYAEYTDIARPMDGCGKLLTLVFEPLTDVGAGQFPIILIPEEAVAVSGAGFADVDVRAAGSMIAAGAGSRGDANGDGAITSIDSLLLRKHLAGNAVDADFDAMDVNGDGRVSSVDSLLLRKHLAGNDVGLGGPVGGMALELTYRGADARIEGVRAGVPVFLKLGSDAAAASAAGMPVQSMGGGLFAFTPEGGAGDVVRLGIEKAISVYRADFIVEGRLYSSVQCKAGEAIPVPDDPEKSGARFVGWSPEVPAKMPGENLRFDALWSDSEESDTAEATGVEVKSEYALLTEEECRSLHIKQGSICVQIATVEGIVMKLLSKEYTADSGTITLTYKEGEEHETAVTETISKLNSIKTGSAFTSGSEKGLQVDVNVHIKNVVEIDPGVSYTHFISNETSTEEETAEEVGRAMMDSVKQTQSQGAQFTVSASSGCKYAIGLVSDLKVIECIVLDGDGLKTELIYLFSNSRIKALRCAEDGDFLDLGKKTYSLLDESQIKDLIKDRKMCTVTLAGGADGPVALTCWFGEKLDLSELEGKVSKTGFRLYGWSRVDLNDGDFTSRSVLRDGIIVIEEDMSLYAVWVLEGCNDCRIIANEEELRDMSSDGVHVLVRDIALSKAWVPIESFAGKFDGGGHVIAGLKIASTSESMSSVREGNEHLSSFSGMFCKLDRGAAVQNIMFEKPSIDVSKSSGAVEFLYAGVVAGYCDGASVDNIIVKGGKILCNKYYVDYTHLHGARAGMIIGGAASGAEISDCIVDNNSVIITVDNWSAAGGIVGALERGDVVVKHCVNEGTVTAIAKSFKDGVILFNDYSSDAEAGGIVGSIQFYGRKTISHCYNSGTMDATGTGWRDAGGIIGKIHKNSSTGSVCNCVIIIGKLYEDSWRDKNNDKIYDKPETPSYTEHEDDKIVDGPDKLTENCNSMIAGISTLRNCNGWENGKWSDSSLVLNNGRFGIRMNDCTEVMV